MPRKNWPAMREQLLSVTEQETIALRFFSPGAPARAVVVISPAMGVPQDFYGDFAQWLAERGFLAVTFDYRGMGRPRLTHPKAVKTDILGWARQDCAAVLDAIEEEAPGLLLCWLGHSLGGQIAPLIPNRARIAKIITVSSGSGYWLENAPQLKRVVWLLWYFIAPLSLRLVGYFPGSKFGMVGDLPHGVMKQWRSWCLHRNYFFGVEGQWLQALFLETKVPVYSLSFTDDELMSERNIAALHHHFPHENKTLKRIKPSEEGIARIGHFGFFRQSSCEPLWASQILPQLESLARG